MDETEFDRFADQYYELHTQYTKYSGEDPDFFFEYKIRDVATALPESLDKPINILDFGTGIGSSVPYLKKYFSVSELTGIDVSRRSLGIARPRFPGLAHYVVVSGETLPFRDAQFDLVFTSCVFHHIPHRAHLPIFREIHRVLKKDGDFFLFEHNPRNPLTVRTVKACPFDENAELIDAKPMSVRLREAGFVTTTLRYRLFFPGFLRQLRSLEKYMMWIPLGAQYYIHANRIV